MSVYKRGGVYWYDFWFREQRCRESTKLADKTAALSVEAVRKAEFAQGRAGIVRKQPCPKFENFVTNDFLPWSEKQHAAHPRMHVRYTVSCNRLVKTLGRLTLESISPGEVERFKLERSEEVSRGGTNRDLAALRLMLNYAVGKGLISRNPVQGVKLLPEGPGAMRVVSQEEQRKYLAKASPLLRDVATLMLGTGMRPEEVFTIRKENVHLNHGYVFVPTGKTRFARRNIPLTDAARAILKRRVKRTKSPYVFPNRIDPTKPLTTIKRAHEETLTEARLSPRFRVYDLRPTFGSRTAMAGVDLPTLKDLMGHSDISTTMRYVHPTPEHKKP